MEYKVRQKRIDEDVWMQIREKEVLPLWPTGKEVDLADGIEYQKKLPDTKNFSKVMENLKKEKKTVPWPRGGYPLLEDEITLCRTIVDSGCPLIPVSTDSYTRNLQFQKVEDILKEIRKTGKNLLNGYPIINYGVKNTRKVVESCDGAFNPRQTRLCQALGTEIAFASGMTAVSASPFVYFGSYEKLTTLEETIRDMQYTFRLMGYYADHGVTLATDMQGWLPGGVFPLSVKIATMIIGALIAAEQGVVSIIPEMVGLGCLAQDIAWIRLAPRLMREYLDRFGYQHVIMPGTIGGQLPIYPLPVDVGMAFGCMNYYATIGVLGEVEAVDVKTVDEGAGVATPESHTVTYKSVNWILEVIRKQGIHMEIQESRQEEHISEMEVRAILEKVLDLGDGDIVVGSIRAVDAGVLDSPFSPNRHVKDQVLGVKDLTGACRYLEFGNLPIPEEAKKFHRAKVAEREKAEGRKMTYMVSVEDFWAFAQGKLTGIPGSV